MHVVRTPLVVLSLLLAGCAAAPVEVASCAGESCEVVVDIAPIPDAEPSPYDRVQGVVIDPLIVPIDGAHVELWQGPARLAEATTGNDGKFSFLKVPDQAYQIKVQHAKYHDTEVLVLPVAKPQHIMVQIEPVFEQPRHTLVQWDGTLRCGLYAATSLTELGCLPVDFLVGTPQDDARVFGEELQMPGPPAALAQIEMVWKPGMDQSKALTLDVRPRPLDGGRDGAPHRAVGPSPLWVGFNQTVIAEHNIGATHQASGLYATVAAGAGENAVGFAFEQTFTAYVSMVYGEPPADGWAYVIDGAP